MLIVSDLSALIAEAAGNAQAHGWHEVSGKEATNKDINEKLLLIISEVVEAMDELRAGKDKHACSIDDETGKPEGFGVELADVAVRLFDLCGWLGIDLTYLINLKMRYNDTRPYRHGKEF